MTTEPSDKQAPRPQEVFISYSRKDKDFVRVGDEDFLWARRLFEVFISYSRKDKDFVRRLYEDSRKDKDFVRRLYEALKSRGREAWVDWQDIRPTEEWMQAIYAAIE